MLDQITIAAIVERNGFVSRDKNQFGHVGRKLHLVDETRVHMVELFALRLEHGSLMHEELISLSSGKEQFLLLIVGTAKNHAIVAGD